MRYLICICSLFCLSSCTNTDCRFSGDWLGSGFDSECNKLTFAAKVTSLGDDKYRMQILDSLDTKKEPMHIMDGTLKGSIFEYTSDKGLYKGLCTLEDGLLHGYYVGPFDGVFRMQKVEGK